MKINRLVFTALLIFATCGSVGITYAEDATDTAGQQQKNQEHKNKKPVNLKKSDLKIDEDLAALNKAANKYNKKQQKEKNKVVCGKEAKLGTRVKHKVCRSHAIMRRDERRAKDTLDVNSKR